MTDRETMERALDWLEKIAFKGVQGGIGSDQSRAFGVAIAPVAAALLPAALALAAAVIRDQPETAQFYARQIAQKVREKLPDEGTEGRTI